MCYTPFVRSAVCEESESVSSGMVIPYIKIIASLKHAVFRVDTEKAESYVSVTFFC